MAQRVEPPSPGGGGYDERAAKLERRAGRIEEGGGGPGGSGGWAGGWTNPSGIFAVVPPGTYSQLGALVLSVASVELADATLTYLSPEVANTSPILTPDASDATKIRITGSFSVLLSTGTVTFQANATGYRRLTIEAFDQGDLSLGSADVLQFAGSSAANQVHAFSYPIANTSAYYFKIGAYQSSGGALSMAITMAMMAL
jgi:hypothetical protein